MVVITECGAVVMIYYYSICCNESTPLQLRIIKCGPKTRGTGKTRPALHMDLRRYISSLRSSERPKGLPPGCFAWPR